MQLGLEYFNDAYKRVNKEVANYITAKVMGVAEEEHIDLSVCGTMVMERDGEVECLYKPKRLYIEEESGLCVMQYAADGGALQETYVEDLTSNELIRLVEVF